MKRTLGIALVLAALAAVPTAQAQESYRRLPELPKGMLLRPKAMVPGQATRIVPPPSAPCATAMPRAAVPSPDAVMPQAAPQSPQAQSRELPSHSPCPDRLRLLAR